MKRRSPGSLAALVVGTFALAGCQIVLGIETRTEKTTSVSPVADGGFDVVGSDGATLDAPVRCDVDAALCSGACVDLSTSGANCGECGHSCFDGGCARGECVPEKLVDVAQGLIAAVDDTEIFYRPSPYDTFLAPLRARNKVTGAERPLGDVGRWYAATAHGSDLVVVENAPVPRVRSINRQTGASTVLYAQATADPAFQHLSVDGDTVYFTTRADVRRVKLDGTGYAVLHTITEGVYGAAPIAVDATRIFFGVIESPNLYAIAKSDPFASPTVASSGTGNVTTIDLLGGDVLWTSASTLQILRPTGAAPARDLGFRVAHSSATRGGMLYVYDVVFGARESRIVRIDPASGAAFVLASGLADGRLAVDDTHVYFANYSGGLYRIPR